MKHGLIKSAGYYQWLKDHRQEISRRDLEVCQEMVLESNQIKRKVVEADPTEKGERALLNFGHTLGHGIEKLKEFTMYHGHCVGIGCIAAAQISVRKGFLLPEAAQDIRGTMAAFDIPTSVSGLSPEDVIGATKNDKKMERGVVKFILLSAVGSAFVDRTVTDEEMREGLKTVLTAPKE